MDDIFLHVALGGAILILIYGGVRITQRYPRIKRTKPLDQIREEARSQWEATERERIRAGQACSDKTHWR